jgi:hypothetical protein
VGRWNAFSAAPVLQAFVTVRNEVTAHTQLWFDGKAHLPTDIGSLEIKWKDLAWAIGQMQAMVELLGNLIRDAGFAWQALDEMFTRYAAEFWCVSDDAGGSTDNEKPS